jgi:hypothetical protein
MYSPRLVNVLNAIAYRFQGLMEQSIKDVLTQDRYKNTGAGAASVVVDVIEGNESKAPALKITFDDHLIFLNQKRIQWTRLPEMKNLITWAETKKSTREEAERLAWAVAWDKKKNDTWKPKPWRKKSLSAVLKEMNTVLLQEFDKAIDEDFQDAAKL